MRKVPRPEGLTGRGGFTLIEVLVALALFGFAIVVVEGGRLSSLRRIRQSENLAVAVQLASMKMAEMQLKFQKLVDKDGIESAYSEEAGTFEAPHADYSWKATFAESGLQMSAGDLAKLMQSFGIDEDEAEAQVEGMKLMLTNLNKMIKTNYGELKLVVEWEVAGRKRSFPLVTHLSPTRPKIELTTTTENAGGDTP